MYYPGNHPHDAKMKKQDILVTASASLDWMFKYMSL